jgi:hypothetical protein
MKQFKEDINKILKDNDTERTLILRFFDGYLIREELRDRTLKGFAYKEFAIGIIVGVVSILVVS